MKLDELLRGSRVDADWLDVAGVARTAARRRRRRWSVGATTVLVVAAAAVVPVVTWPSTQGQLVTAQLAAPAGARIGARLAGGVELVADQRPSSTADPAAIAPVARAEQALTVSLLRQLSAQQQGGAEENLSVAPSSLAIALAMLQNGAAGSTLAGIRQTLQTSGLSSTQQNAGWQALAAAWQRAAAAGKITLSSANSLFAQAGFPIKSAFLSALGSYYDSGVWQVDFAQHLDGALDTINRWTSQQTHGQITKLFQDGQLDETTVAVLANAVYFHAAWSQPFDPLDSQPLTFYGSSGQTRPTFMTQTSAVLPWAVGTGYQAVQLPYTGGRFAALAVMPTTGSLGQFVAGLTPERLAGIAATLHTGTPATVTLPRFSTASALDLRTALSALGMADAFTSRANFAGLSSIPTQVQAVEQRIQLAVGEKGTEAAAATGIGVQASSAESSEARLTFDHPFVFLVRDTQTGAILFACLVQKPAG